MQRSKKARESRGKSSNGYKGLLAKLRSCYSQLNRDAFSRLTAAFKRNAAENGYDHWKAYAVAFMKRVFQKGTSRVSPKLLMKGDIAVI